MIDMESAPPNDPTEEIATVEMMIISNFTRYFNDTAAAKVTAQTIVSYFAQRLAEKDREIQELRKEKTLAERLHERYALEVMVENVIDEALEKHELDSPRLLDYHTGSDWYDNSIEIYFENVIPYPWEPSPATRKAIYDLGFSIVYWNFVDNKGQCTEEIRGWEPRRFKNADHHLVKWGYVDDRFNEEEYIKNYRTDK